MTNDAQPLLIDPATIDRKSPADKPPGCPVMHQRWAYLLFLHWVVPAAELQKLVPSRLTIDTFDGKAYVGLVPFTMTGVRPIFIPPIPGLSDFHETNVRTYVHDGGKNPGVYFFSLDAANAIAVKVAQWLFKLPYHFAKMELKARKDTRSPGIVDYSTERSWPGPTPATLTTRYEVTGPVDPAKPGTLDHFLIERYILYTQNGSKLMRGRVHHHPYPVQPARVHSVKEDLILAAGIKRPEVAPLVHYASEVQVQVYALEEAK
jgi:uncharacterized protein YqjF (DUF2071 family)